MDDKGSHSPRYLLSISLLQLSLLTFIVSELIVGFHSPKRSQERNVMFQEPCGSFTHMSCPYPTLTQRGGPQKWDFVYVWGHGLLNHFWKENLPWLVYSDSWIGRLKWFLFPCNHWVYSLGHRAPSDILRVLLPLAALAALAESDTAWRGPISLTLRRCDL